MKLGYLFKEGVKNAWSNRTMTIASIAVLVSCLYCGAAPGVSDGPIPKAVCFWQRQLHRVPVPFRQC